MPLHHNKQNISIYRLVSGIEELFWKLCAYINLLLSSGIGKNKSCYSLCQPDILHPSLWHITLPRDIVLITQNARIKVTVVYCWHIRHWYIYIYISSAPGGRGYSQKSWVGVCGSLPKTLTLLMTKICYCCYSIYDLAKNSIPYLWPLQLEQLP